MYGSVSYWAFGVGATVRGTRAYSLEVATAPSAIRTASSTSYTVSNTSVSCIVSAEGTGFYVTVLSDSGQPIEGAQVSAVRVTSTSGGTCTQTVSSLLTNSTGSVLITPNIGSYYLLTIQYQGKTFSTHAPIDPMQTTYVLLKLPSGSISISEVPFGGCQRTSNSTMCPV
jgi:predicted extracellular nuclease